jgi:hypothetical protein
MAWRFRARSGFGHGFLGCRNPNLVTDVPRDVELL